LFSAAAAVAKAEWVDRIFASAEAEAVFLLAVSNDPEDE